MNDVRSYRCVCVRGTHNHCAGQMRDYRIDIDTVSRRCGCAYDSSTYSMRWIAMDSIRMHIVVRRYGYDDVLSVEMKRKSAKATIDHTVWCIHSPSNWMLWIRFHRHRIRKDGHRHGFAGVNLVRLCWQTFSGNGYIDTVSFSSDASCADANWPIVRILCHKMNTETAVHHWNKSNCDNFSLDWEATALHTHLCVRWWSR